MEFTRRLRSVFPILLTLAVAAAAAEQDEDGFVEAFNGKDLSGWVVDGGESTFVENGQEKPVWTVEDGVLKCAGKGSGFLRYDKILCDAVLHVEYRMSPRCNSGLGIRGVKYTGLRHTRPAIAGYEVQILDDAGRKPGTHSSGALYRYVAPQTNAAKPAGQWNVVDIELRGPQIKIALNGQVIQDVNQDRIDPIKDKPLSGYFSLQDQGKPIEFRNIRIKELTSVQSVATPHMVGGRRSGILRLLPRVKRKLGRAAATAPQSSPTPTPAESP